jgi:glyoxylase-like metal-dependent hydrolase (beta-lactamase superfamily II)
MTNLRLYLDHTGAAGRFPEALHIVQRAEYEYAFTPDWFAGAGYIRKDFARPGLRWHFLVPSENSIKWRAKPGRRSSPGTTRRLGRNSPRRRHYYE